MTPNPTPADGATPTDVRLPTSYLTLDASHPHVRGALVDAHRMHQLIMSGWDHAAFPGEPARDTLNILYALDLTSEDTVRVVAQAAVEPRWQLPDSMLATAPVTKPRRAPLHGRIEFRLTATPTRNLPSPPRVGSEKRARGRKVPLPAAEHYPWGKRILTGAGLAVHDLTITTIGRLHSDTKSLPSDQRPTPKAVFTYTPVTYTGIATITDPDQHRHALTHGIGPGKPYGCGLLLTRPYHRVSRWEQSIGVRE